VTKLIAGYQPGTLLVDPFWVGFFVDTFRDGFRRRALVGSLCRLAFPAGLPIGVINGLALLILLACLAVWVRALCRVSLETGGGVYVFALSASALLAAFAEVTGDLLQVALLVFCVLTLAQVRGLPEPARVLAGLAAMVAGFFVHEASVFLLAAALPFFVKERPRVRDFVLPVALAAGLLALSLHWSQLYPQATYRALLTHGRVMMADAASTPAFRWELRFEYQVNYSSGAAFASFAGRCVRTALLGLAGLLALARCMEGRGYARAVYALACILGVSAPLWGIAHDWGRFLAYSFFLAVVSGAVWQGAEGAAPRPFAALAEWLRTLAGEPLLAMGAVFVLVGSLSSGSSHIEGLNVPTAVGFCVIAAVWGVYRVAGRSTAR
jgi:hypothetical protein